MTTTSPRSGAWTRSMARGAGAHAPAPRPGDPPALDVPPPATPRAPWRPGRPARLWPVAGALALLASLGACSSTPDLPQCSVAAGASDRLEGYALGPGDKLRVTVFRHENLSGEYTLDATGSVALPLVGDLQADGLTTRELEARTEERLREQGYLVDPRVSMEVLTYRPFYVLGEVAQPGEYEYVSGMNVTNAVAVAGGYTYRADPSDVIISRRDCFIEAAPATKVLPGEVVRVPERFF